MKILIITILILTWIQNNNTPIGVWEYKEDSSRMEIINKNGKLSGTLISSDNPNRQDKKEIVRNVQFLEGKWRGEFYQYKSNRWATADFEVNENILFIKYQYGFLTKIFRFYREK